MFSLYNDKGINERSFCRGRGGGTRPNLPELLENNIIVWTTVFSLSSLTPAPGDAGLPIYLQPWDGN